MKVKNYKITAEFNYQGAFYQIFITTEDESQAITLFSTIKKQSFNVVRIKLEERFNFEEYKTIKLY